MLLMNLFVFLIAITVGLTALQLLGYGVLNSLIIMLVIDFIALGATLQNKNKKIENPGNPHNLIPRLENIEKTCSNVLEHLNTNSVKQDVLKSKDDLTYILERISRRTMQLEQKIDNFGKTLATSMLDISGRIRKLEGVDGIAIPEEIETIEPPQKQRLTTGEVIYVDENNS